MTSLAGYRGFAQQCADKQKRAYVIVRRMEYLVLPDYMLDSTCELIETVNPRPDPEFVGEERRNKK